MPPKMVFRRVSVWSTATRSVQTGGRSEATANFANRATLDPETKCWLPGVPRATYMGFPFQIVQTPTQVSILHEYGHALRTSS